MDHVIVSVVSNNALTIPGRYWSCQPSELEKKTYQTKKPHKNILILGLTEHQ